MAPTIEGELRAQMKSLNNIKNLVNAIYKDASDKRDKIHFETQIKLLNDYWTTFCKRDATDESRIK